MTTPRVTVPVDVLRELIDASSEVRDLLANVPEMQDRKYVGTGNRFVNAIGAAQRSCLSAAPAPEGGAVKTACVDFQEAIDDFEAEVADVMAEGSERADLWDREITVNIDALKTVMSAALATREEAPAEAGSFEERAIALVKKYGNPNGSDYEQGQNDMGHRMVTMAREADAALRAQPQAREDAQPVISAGRVLADALRQYGFPVSGGAKAALWDHGSAEALALNEACVAFLAALQAEQGAK